jgi:hypothetical protein
MALDVLHDVASHEWEAKMNTGNDVHKFGLYSSDCCLLEVFFDSGNVFSRCPRCMSLCEWEMADLTSTEMKALITKVKLQKPRTGRMEGKEVRLWQSYGV